MCQVILSEYNHYATPGDIVTEYSKIKLQSHKRTEPQCSNECRQNQKYWETTYHSSIQTRQFNIILQSATQTIPATINLRKSCDVPVEDAQLATNAIQRRHNQGPAVGLKQVLLQREVTTVEVLELPREEF